MQVRFLLAGPVIRPERFITLRPFSFSLCKPLFFGLLKPVAVRYVPALCGGTFGGIKMKSGGTLNLGCSLGDSVSGVRVSHRATPSLIAAVWMCQSQQEMVLFGQTAPCS